MRLSRPANRITIAIKLHPEYRYKPRKAQVHVAKLCRKKRDNKSSAGKNPSFQNGPEEKGEMQGEEKNVIEMKDDRRSTDHFARTLCAVILRRDEKVVAFQQFQIFQGKHLKE